MTIILIISLCVLLLFAYVFDFTSSKTKIPAVILLLILGWSMKQLIVYFGLNIPDLFPILPILGTIGLILIVLEGSLELELNQSKLKTIVKSSLLALLPMIILSIGLAYSFQFFSDIDFKLGLINAIPLAIISSAIAIPSVKNLLSGNKEFVTYESSLSDIFGVLFFDFLRLNNEIELLSFGHFLLEIVIIALVSFIATLSLSYLLGRINHTVKFVPIILLVILIYSVAKVFHLPALIFIVLFGLFLGNIDKFQHFRLIQKIHLNPGILKHEVLKFKELTTEMAFLIRSLFFLLFGFLIEADELLNLDTMIWSVLISVSIFLLRYIYLKILRLPINPIVFIAPRGLITILLFLAISVNQSISIVNRSLIIQVIIITSLVMMVGLMMHEKAESLGIEEVE